MNIFTLTGTILVDSASAEKSISKTGEQAEGLGSKLSAGIATAAKWGAAITTAAVAVGGAMVAAAKDTASTLDTIDKASQRMSISAESYQELAYQANLCGVEMSTMEKAAKKLEGTDLNMDDALKQIYALGTAEERSAKAAELFGDNIAYTLSPMLNQSAEDMAAMAAEANNLGLVIDGDAVTAGANLNDMFTKVESSLTALKTNLMTQMMPYVEKILDWVLENIPTIQETVGSVMAAVWPLVETVLNLVMTALPPLLDAIKKFLDWIMPYLKPIIDSISGVVEGVIALINGDVDTFAESIKTVLTTLGESLFGIGKDIFNWLWDGLKEKWEEVKTWITEKTDWVKDKFQFWKDTNAQMASDSSGVKGYHASGLNYVPYDGYVASLHKGESVMSAGDNNRLIEAITSLASMPMQSQSGPIELTLNIDGAAFARATYNATQNEANRRGGSLVTV